MRLKAQSKTPLYMFKKKNQINLAYENEQMRLVVNVNGLNQPNIEKKPTILVLIFLLYNIKFNCLTA